MIYVCFAQGMADFLPNSQEYRSFENVPQLIAGIHNYQRDFEEAIGEVYHHPIPRHVLNAWNNGAQGSWRIAIAKDCDEVLDVIAMTEAEFCAEQAE